MTDRLDHLLTKKFTNRTEAQNLNAICQYLSARKYFWWRQNNHGVRRVKSGREFWTNTKWALPGVPDIFLMRPIPGYIPTILYGIEVKAALGRQSPAQKLFQRDFEANGGVYILARGVDCLIKIGL